MKTFAEIEITFADDITSGTISFIVDSEIDANVFTVTEEFTGIRTKSGEVNVAEETANPGEASAIEFVKAFNADYNLSKLFVVERAVNVVTIKSTDYDVFFDIESFEAPVDVSATFEDRGPAPFAIISITFAEHASDKCGKVMANVLCNYPPGILLLPVTIPNPGNNPMIFELPRTGATTVFILSREGDIIQQQRVVPGTFTAASIQITSNPNGSSSTVTINMNAGAGLNFEYSLNDTDWQTANVFPGLVVGNYTIYVRDQYGCKRQRNFVVNAVGGIRSPYIHVPKSNSIRYANRITWGDAANYKNDENTLSCEVDVPVVWKEIQQFQSADIITTQVRSNFDNISVLISGEVDPLVDPIFIPTVQVTNNMNLRDRRDAMRFQIPVESGGTSEQVAKTGIYFTSGNTYNYDTGVVNGNYVLNGNLPEWGVAGNWIRVASNWFLIEDVIYDEDRQAFVLVANTGYEGVEGSVEVSSLYNRFNYEVYEFTIDFFNYLNKKIQVNIGFGDSLFEQVDYISEVIHVKVRHKNTLELRYKNKTNTDVFYGTGIEHKIRLPYERQDGFVLDESENYKTDTDAILLNASVYEGDVFEFGPMTKEIMRQVVQAIHHSFLKVDGVDYVKESVEVEGALEESNLYMVKATLAKARNVYSSDTGDMEFSEGALEIPGLVDAGSNSYVKYV